MPHTSAPLFHLPSLVTLLAADALFVTLHVANRMQEEPEPMLLLSSPKGWPEAFQYLKEASTAGLLLAAGWRNRVWLLAVWAMLFAYLLFDDLLEIHEHLGHAIATQWSYPAVFGLRPRDLGEVTVSLLVAAGFLVTIFSIARRSPSPFRHASQDLTCLLALLGFFGVCVDTAHMAVESLQIRGLTLLEDGGEMAVMSLIFAYALNLYRRPDAGGAGGLWRWTQRFLPRLSKSPAATAT
jgi:hypothetical protein